MCVCAAVYVCEGAEGKEGRKKMQREICEEKRIVEASKKGEGAEDRGEKTEREEEKNRRREPKEMSGVIGCSSDFEWELGRDERATEEQEEKEVRKKQRMQMPLKACGGVNEEVRRKLWKRGKLGLGGRR